MWFDKINYFNIILNNPKNRGPIIRELLSYCFGYDFIIIPY